MSNETKTRGGQADFGNAVPVNRPQLMSVGQATDSGSVAVAPNPSVPQQEPDTNAPAEYAEPSWADLLIDASLSSIKAGVAGAVVGAALSAPGKRSKMIVRGATVSATVSPVAFGLIELGRIQIRETTPEQKAAERRFVMKSSGIALCIGGAALALDYFLSKGA
jgi:hypothetical protein